MGTRLAPGWSLSKGWWDEQSEEGVHRRLRGLSAGQRSGRGLEGLPDVTGILPCLTLCSVPRLQQRTRRVQVSALTEHTF